MTYIHPRHALGVAYTCDIMSSYLLLGLYSIFMCLLAYVQIAYLAICILYCYSCELTEMLGSMNVVNVKAVVEYERCLLFS